MFAARTPPHLVTLALLTGLSVLTLNMFLPALPAMAEDFRASPQVMAWAVSGYMLASGLLQLVMGPLSDRFGRRPVMLAALALYGAASLGCLLAQEIGPFLICRALQAAVVAGAVLSAAAIRDCAPPDQAAARLGLVSAAMALAPMLGPMLGGLLTAMAGWRAAFGFYSVASLAALALVWMDMGETRTGRGRSVAAQRAAYRALLFAPAFWGYALCLTFSVGAFYIFLAGAPFVAQRQFGLSAAWIGVGLGSITGGYMVGSFVTSRVAARRGLGAMIQSGRIAALAGLSAGMLAVLVGLSHPLILFGSTIFVGLGNGLTLASANAGAMSVDPDSAGSAAGLAGALVVLGGAGLSAVTVAILDWQGGPLTLLALMWTSVLLSLLAGLYAQRAQGVTAAL